MLDGAHRGISCLGVSCSLGPGRKSQPEVVIVVAKGLVAGSARPNCNQVRWPGFVEKALWRNMVASKIRDATTVHARFGDGSHAEYCGLRALYRASAAMRRAHAARPGPARAK